MRLRSIFVLLVLGFAGALRLAAVDSAVSLVLTYRAQPEHRVAFRAWWEGEGGRQFARWRAAGVFANARILFGSIAGNGPVDALVLIDFPRFSDLARWTAIEREFPGGLTADALKLAHPTSAHLAEPIAGAATAAAPAGGVQLVAFYSVSIETARYRDYVRGYVEPQMRGWLEAGALKRYTLLANQAALHDPWDALLVLDYVDYPALARRDEVKRAVRERLAANDPAWAQWSRDKADVRRELSLFLTEAIPLPAAN